MNLERFFQDSPWWKWSKKSKSANRKELENIQDQDVQVI
jgi:hypothetical protein